MLADLVDFLASWKELFGLVLVVTVALASVHMVVSQILGAVRGRR